MATCLQCTTEDTDTEEELGWLDKSLNNERSDHKDLPTFFVIATWWSKIPYILLWGIEPFNSFL